MSCLEKHFSVSSMVKWPNDVLTGGRKISGILCENTDRYILCGCGINLNQKEFPELNCCADGKSCSDGMIAGSAKKAVSLYQLSGKNTDPDDFLIKLLDGFQTGLDSLDWKPILEKNLYLKGEHAVVSEGIPGRSERIEGLIKGIGEYGQLIIEEKSKGTLREVYSGEII